MPRLLAVVLALALGTSACSGDTARDQAGGADRPSTQDTTSNGCGRPDPPQPGTEQLTVVADGRERVVERVLPTSYDGTTPQPLLLNLHGFSSTISQQNLFSNLPEVAAERGYVLLTPQAESSSLTIGAGSITAPLWNLDPEGGGDGPDDVAFLSALLSSAQDELCIDDARIYATGNSNGAGMTTVLACSEPGRLAAIAPVSGVNLADRCANDAPLSVLAFHGNADPLVRYEGIPGDERAGGVDSVPDRMQRYADAAGCDEQPRQTTPFDDLLVWEWPSCGPGLAVELVTVIGGGHTWPGLLNYVDPAQLIADGAASSELLELTGLDLLTVAGNMTVNIEATSAMLDFFDAHLRP